MCVVALDDPLASAAAVFFGRHGDVTSLARNRQVSRQTLYREAHALRRYLDSDRQHLLVQSLNDRITLLQTQLNFLQQQHHFMRPVGTDQQAEFVATAQAEGVSLPVARRLLAVFLGDDTPSVASLGRLSQQAALQAAAVLDVFDELARPLVEQVAADEIFFGNKPTLMVVEPDSLCWLSGRLSQRRDGQAWASELEHFPALEHVVRDGGQGLARGVGLVNEQRQQDNKEPIREQLDHFHTLREAGRGVRKAQGRAERAWTAAEEADKKVARQNRQGQSQAGHATVAARKWREAEAALHEWERVEGVVQEIGQTLRPFTPAGKLRSRVEAMAAVARLAGQLEGAEWDKFKRQLAAEQTYTYLDRLQAKAESLAVPVEVREAVVEAEGLRQKAGTPVEGGRASVLQGVLLMLGMLIASAGAAGAAAVRSFRRSLRCVGRSSSCVEGVNSVVRMQQSRHRKMTQGLLDLKRLYWNLRQQRSGSRKGSSPYQRLGVPLPPELSWWQILRLSPDQLRAHLSDCRPAA